MTPEQMAAFALFALAASITPGPNNTMMMASGANFGLRRTAPHMAGVVLGFGFLVLCVGLGLGGLFTAFPVLQGVLWFVGTAYLMWLAWKIATAGGIGGGQAARPMRFLEVVAFQWVNPKAWTGAVGAISAYAPRENYFLGLAAISVIFLLVNIPVVLLWTGAGAGLRQALERPGALRVFNVSMALLLVSSLIPPALDRLALAQ